MDITPLFKAYVKSVKTRNKAFGVLAENSKSKIIKPRLKSGFSSTAREITSHITRLRDFLLESKEPYLSFFDAAGKNEMSEAERDQIENAAQKIINNCSVRLKEFRNETRKMPASVQMREHMDSVLDIMDKYLKCVCKILSEIKALRVRRAIEIRQLSRLELPRKISLKLEKKQSDSESEKESESEAIDGPKSMQGETRKEAKITPVEMDRKSSQELELSPEELQIFESENAQLYNELNSLTEEVKQIESKVLHIAELQEIFTEKVLQQEQDIDRISNVVVGATENVTDANEQIKQAIQRNAGLRVWVIFFLLVMSFSLLFLDWYND